MCLDSTDKCLDHEFNRGDITFQWFVGEEDCWNSVSSKEMFHLVLSRLKGLNEKFLKCKHKPGLCSGFCNNGYCCSGYKTEVDKECPVDAIAKIKSMRKAKNHVCVIQHEGK